jgi:hypothetical protein
VLAISDGSEPGHIVDARPADRFNGIAPEPWQYTQSTSDIEVRPSTEPLTVLVQACCMNQSVCVSSILLHVLLLLLHACEQHVIGCSATLVHAERV